MRYKFKTTKVTLFPFLSVLLCTLGILAFLSISFLLVIPETQLFRSSLKQIEFQWVGAPKNVKPIFFRCFSDRVEYFNFFENRNYTLSLNGLLEQIQGENPDLIEYLFKISKLNKSIKKQFGKNEYYPLLLIYPDGILTSELIMVLVEKIGGLNFGMEPMLPNMEVPYQEQS